MQFNSYAYIFAFLPLLAPCYYLANKVNITIGKIVLIAASILFYALGRADMLIYLGISMAINYGAALLIKNKKLSEKLFLFFPVVVNVLLLLYFKYTNFAISNVGRLIGKEYPMMNIVMPLGISFYTFQQIAYIVAVSRDELENVSVIDYLCYILYFPKLVMGPLMEPSDFMNQINDRARKNFKVENLAFGLKIFSYGLFKKVLLADTFSRAVTWIYNNMEYATPSDCILLILFYTFEIYFDFSGYSDMAVGASGILGIDLPINFDSPYKAVSIRDFWKRWHISLTKFLTKYIYIPLGGSRKGELFTYLNTMIVFLVSGLWHGANWTFILWGALHGFFSVFDRLFDKIENKVFVPVRWALTFGVVNVLWLLFSAESISQWIEVLKKALHIRDLRISDGVLDVFELTENTVIYDVLRIDSIFGPGKRLGMFAFIVAAFVICLIPENNYKTKDRIGAASLILSSVAFIWGVICLGAESTFVYFGF
jgi:alginate O-acetyltransferase complex protein AlgI